MPNARVRRRPRLLKIPGTQASRLWTRRQPCWNIRCSSPAPFAGRGVGGGAQRKLGVLKESRGQGKKSTIEAQSSESAEQSEVHTPPRLLKKRTNYSLYNN